MAKFPCGCEGDPAFVKPEHSPTPPHHVRLDGSHDHAPAEKPHAEKHHEPHPHAKHEK